MLSIRVLADGTTPQAQANARGRLFEDLMTKVIERYAYRVTAVPRRHYAGMEIDIEAVQAIGGTRLYAECKCYAESVAAPQYQAFFGKFMAHYLRDNNTHGLFVALPGTNGAVWAFHKDNVASANLPVEIIEQDRVIALVVDAGLALHPEVVTTKVSDAEGAPGDQIMLYTDQGVFWAQFLIRPGAVTPTAGLIIDKNGHRITDETFVESLTRLAPELHGFDWLGDTPDSGAPADDLESSIVEVKGSSAYFEYQFPAAPEYFVGRQASIERLDAFAHDVALRRTSSRSLLVEASSGWGKSSFVLSSVERLRNQGHFATTIDSRSASSSQFALEMVANLPQLARLAQILPPELRRPTISGFDSAVKHLTKINEVLVANDRLLVVFLDQFENMFFEPSVLNRVHDLFTQITDLSGNIVIGFAWKTDLVGVMDDFPFSRRDSIRSSSRLISLPRFGEEETNAVLDQLRQEMRVASLRQDLKFLLAEFSQGFPWLLMKLCAHVRAQRDNGARQAEIATSVLNVDELFREDLDGLSAKEEEALRAVARAAPIAVSELGDEFDPSLVQSLINQRLVVRIGNRYDIYWDIFRDFLNSGRLPVQEHYILRMSIRSVISRVRLLAEAGQFTLSDFALKAGLSQQSLYNIVRDMRMLGLVEVSAGSIVLRVEIPADDRFDVALRTILRDRLSRNRMVKRVIEQLEDTDALTLEGLADALAEMASYMSAASTTWAQYARVLADWLDFADLAVFDARGGVLRRLTRGTEVRDRTRAPVRRRGDLPVPRVQYSPIATAVERLVDAAQERRQPDWSGFSASTVRKALGDLGDLGFLQRQGASLLLDAVAIQFYSSNATTRAQIFATHALELRPFAEFIEIIRDGSMGTRSNEELGLELSKRLGFRWSDGTAATNAKIMLDWARHSGLAPESYEFARRGRRRSPQQALQLSSNQ